MHQASPEALPMMDSSTCSRTTSKQCPGNTGKELQSELKDSKESREAMEARRSAQQSKLKETWKRSRREGQ